MSYVSERAYQELPLEMRDYQSPPPLILLIEPDDAIRGLLCDVLLLQGYRVSMATPETGADQLAALHPQALIVDFGPSLGGRHLGLLRELRSSPARQHLPLLLTTTSTTIDSVSVQHLQQLRCEVLHQPFDLQVLLDWLESRLPHGCEPLVGH